MSAEEPQTTSKVSVEWVDNDLFVGSDEAGHSIVFDSSLSKRTARGIGPMRALLSSLGACSGMDVAAILQKRKQRVDSLSVEVSGKRPQFGRTKPFTEIHLRFRVSGKVEDKHVKEAVSDSVTKFCSVASTLSEKVKISYDYEITPSLRA